MIDSPQLDQIVKMMKLFPSPWFIAGGWALDLAYGKQTRPHQDVDLCCFRESSHELLRFFSDWDRQIAIPGEHLLVPCTKEEDILPPRHELHFSKEDKRIEILLIDRAGSTVIFRRDPSINLPLEEFQHIDKMGRPFVSPGWQLLYKAKNPRAKDHKDFFQHAPQLSKKDKIWLWTSLQTHQPESSWITPLEKMIDN